MKNIVHVITDLNVGGAEMMLYRLTAASSDAQMHHTVISLLNNGEMAKFILEKSVRVIELNFKKKPLLSFFELVKEIKKTKPDIVQTWLYHADLLGGVAAFFLGYRNIIWCVHSTHLPFGGSKSSVLVRWICSLLSKFVPKKIVYVAESSRNIHESVGYDRKKSTVINNGFEISDSFVTEERRGALLGVLGIPSGFQVVGWVGRFNSDKDPENFIKSAKILCDNFSKIIFIMVGKGIDADNELLSRWIESTGSKDKFILLGPRNDIQELFSVMDVFCLSSKTEAFPLVVGEAMAYGVPCVVTDVGDVKALVGGGGIVVDPDNCAQLASGIKSFLEMDNDSIAKIKNQNRNRIKSEFSFAGMILKYTKLYESLGS